MVGGVDQGNSAFVHPAAHPQIWLLDSHSDSLYHVDDPPLIHDDSTISMPGARDSSRARTGF